MLSKNFIFTALFFGIIIFCISCLGNETTKPYQQFYGSQPTDSSNFTISLDALETIKTTTFDLDGKWKLVDENTQKSQPLYFIFEGRKIFSSLESNFNSFYKKVSAKEDNYQVFAIYDKCPDENGTFNKNGDFLVIGSGKEKLVCYKIISFEKDKIILYDTEKGGEIELIKVK